MSITYESFKADLVNEISVAAESGHLLTEDAFFDVITDIIVNSGDIETADRCFFVKHGMRIDGYCGDPIDTDGVLTVLVCDYDSNPALSTATKADVELACKRASNFISSCLSSRFLAQLEESSSEFGLADLINQRWPAIRKVRIIYVTTRVVNLRRSSFEPVPVNGVSAQFSCWDLARIHSFVLSGKEKEPVDVVLSQYGGSLPVLAAHNVDSDLRSYLCVIPASSLASIYNDFGTQLLEKNVRVFLQAKGSVNKGIRRSLETEPARFFAYNNGITATADSVETSITKHGNALERISDFQIVNGGQTTASIFDAYLRGVSLDNVYVQMKLTVVSPERSAEIVPFISQYANSQNRVTEADFFSNHPFHIEFEKLSRRVTAPPKPNTTIQTYWFYERARGQYPNAKQACLSKSEKKKFEMLNPRDQLITKTDLAKVLNSFRGHPHIVSKGAQASFRFFAEEVKQLWDKGSEKQSFVTDKFFKDSVSRIILFRTLEKLVSQQLWYQGGYRANIVCYTLALFALRAKSLGKSVNYSLIWAGQHVPEELSQLLVSLSSLCHKHLVSPPDGSPSNVTEYAKTERCWQLLQASDYKLPREAEKFLLTKSAVKTLERDAQRIASLDSVLELQSSLLTRGASYWNSVLEYSSQNNLVTNKDWSLLSRATRFPQAPLESDREYILLQRLLDRAIKHGFVPPS